MEIFLFKNDSGHSILVCAKEQSEAYKSLEIFLKSHNKDHEDFRLHHILGKVGPNIYTLPSMN